MYPCFRRHLQNIPRYVPYRGTGTRVPNHSPKVRSRRFLQVGSCRFGDGSMGTADLEVARNLSHCCCRRGRCYIRTIFTSKLYSFPSVRPDRVLPRRRNPVTMQQMAPILRSQHDVANIRRLSRGCPKPPVRAEGGRTENGNEP